MEIIKVIFVCSLVLIFIFNYWNPTPNFLTKKVVEEDSWDNIPLGVVYTNKVKPLSVESNPIFSECVDALSVLGVSKTEAKKTTRKILSSSNPPSSVEDFILQAFKK